MKNFDTEWAERKSEDARTFLILGAQFVLKKGVRPEALAIRDDLNPETSTVEQSMTALDGLFLSMVEAEEGEAEKRYRELRAREEDALGIGDLNEVIDWMIEQQTGRPPTSHIGSTAGPSRTGKRSTVGSSSPALRVASRR